MPQDKKVIEAIDAVVMWVKATVPEWYESTVDHGIELDFELIKLIHIATNEAYELGYKHGSEKRDETNST